LDTADYTLDAADRSINGRTADRPGGRDASLNRVSGGVHCFSENIHLRSLANARLVPAT
jgi:hypothetical protein